MSSEKCFYHYRAVADSQVSSGEEITIKEGDSEGKELRFKNEKDLNNNFADKVENFDIIEIRSRHERREKIDYFQFLKGFKKCSCRFLLSLSTISTTQRA